MHDIITIGDSGQDIFLQLNEENVRIFCELKRDDCQLCLHYADKIPVAAKHDAVGGNAANAAVAFARLGLRTAIYTHIGSDRPGQRILDEFIHNGVATDYVVRTEGEETNYNTVITVDGERTILVYHGERHYRLPKLAPARWLYFTSMAHGFERILPSLVEYLDEHKVALCYQPGTHQLRTGTRKLKPLLERTKLLFLNRNEAINYLDLEDDQDVPLRTLLNGLHDLGVHTAVITDGGNGCYASNGREYLFLPSIPEVPRIEATGAGDSFASGCTAAIMAGKPLEEALRWGLMEASSVIQKVGAQAGLLKRSELERLLEKYADVQVSPLPRK